MDETFGIDLIDCAGDNLAAIAPIAQFPASADKRVVTRYGEVTAADFVRSGSATYTDAAGNLVLASANTPRIESSGWLLEGSATNKVTCAKSNPSDLTNITKGGDAAAVLSVVNDALALASAGLSAFGPNVYKLDNSAGTTKAFALCYGDTTNTNPHSLSAAIRGGSGSLRYAGTSSGEISITASVSYRRVTMENKTPSVSTDKCCISAAAGSIVYFILPQLEEGPVCTSPIPGGTGAITRASEGADTSGNGLSIPLSQAMVDSLVGELCPNSGFSGTYTSGLAHDWIKGGSPTVSQETTDTDGAAAVQRVSCPAGTGSNRIYTSSPINVVPGGTYQIILKAKLLSGTSPSYCNVALSSTPWTILKIFSPLTTAWGTQTATITIPSNYTGMITVFLGNSGTASASEFLLSRMSIRRVLDSGQTNPGEGTVLCGVYLPWASSVVPQGTSIGLVGPNNAVATLMALNKYNGSEVFGVRINDAVNWAQIPDITPPLPAGRYCLIGQWSAVTGQMRCGIYNPTAKTLTWGSPAAYRGFFHIHSSNLLRFFYGGGAFPIYVRGLKWLESIASDAEAIRLSKEMLP